MYITCILRRRSLTILDKSKTLLKSINIEFQQGAYQIKLCTIQNVSIKSNQSDEKLYFLNKSVQYKMFLLNLPISNLPKQYTIFFCFCRYQYFYIFLSRISFYLFIKQSKNPIKIDITKNLSMSQLFSVITGRQILFKRSLKFYHLRFPKILFLAIFLDEI